MTREEKIRRNRSATLTLIALILLAVGSYLTALGFQDTIVSAFVGGRQGVENLTAGIVLLGLSFILYFEGRK